MTFHPDGAEFWAMQPWLVSEAVSVENKKRSSLAKILQNQVLYGF